MRLIILLLLMSSCITNLNAQVPDPLSSQQILGYPKDLWGLTKAPAYWGKKEWGRSLIAGAVIYGAFTLDQDIHSWVLNKPFSGYSADFLTASRHWGDGLFSLPVFAGLYCWGRIADNQKHQLVAMNATKAFVLSRLLVQLPKFLFQRHPPSKDNSADHLLFDGPLGAGTNRSFSSGHVISIFSAAEVFRSSYDDWWVGAVAYSIAGTVGFQRLSSGSHWFSDVTTSAIWGVAIGHWIVKKGETRLSLLTGSAPNSSTQTVGLLLRF